MSRPPSVTPTARHAGVRGAIGLAASAVLAAGSAQAQSASATLSSYRTGYGGVGLSGLSSPISPSLISAGSSYSITDGVNQSGAVGGVFITQPSNGQTSDAPTSGGAGQSYTGVGHVASGASRPPVAAVESPTPRAASAQGATTAAPEDRVLNGKLNLDGGQ